MAPSVQRAAHAAATGGVRTRPAPPSGASPPPPPQSVDLRAKTTGRLERFEAQGGRVQYGTVGPADRPTSRSGARSGFTGAYRADTYLTAVGAAGAAVPADGG